MTLPSKATLKEQLWSPVQNTSLWLAWWAYDVISTDEVISAFHEVQGPLHHFDAAQSNGAGLVEILRHIRLALEGAPVGRGERPLVSFSAAGPGDAPLMPAGSAAAEAVLRAGAGIVVADADPDVTHVLVPESDMSEYHESPAVRWDWHTVEGPCVPLAVYSPGEADKLLRHATGNAAELIEASKSTSNFGGARARSPRLAVGSLADAYGLPGLPPGVAPRAEQLMARADMVAAIVKTARGHSTVGAHLDPHLLPLLRAVRLARMTAVDYAVRELQR